MPPEATTTAAATTTTDTTAGAAATTTTTAAATQTAPPIAWYPTADEEMVGYVQNKGWKEASDAVGSYKNLEKMLGAEKAGRTVVVPGDGADEAEINAFYDKLGRPQEASKYDIPMPEGSDAAFVEAAKTWFHKAGLSPKQAKAVAEQWNEYVAGVTKSGTEATAAGLAKDQTDLQNQWGAAYDQNLALAQKTRSTLGVTDAEIDKLSTVIGLKRTIEMFHQLGTRTGEADFVPGTGNVNNGALTPGQAQARITELKSDRDWVRRYTAGGKAEQAELTRLHQFAYPAKKQP